MQDTTIDYLKCKETCDINYLHCLNCIIKTVTNTTSRCSLKNSMLLNELLPELTYMSYEDYVYKKPTTIYMLHDLQVHGIFILNEHNDILQIQSNAKGKSSLSL